MFSHPHIRAPLPFDWRDDMLSKRNTPAPTITMSVVLGNLACVFVELTQLPLAVVPSSNLAKPGVPHCGLELL